MIQDHHGVEIIRRQTGMHKGRHGNREVEELTSDPQGRGQRRGENVRDRQTQSEKTYKQ